MEAIKLADITKQCFNEIEYFVIGAVGSVPNSQANGPGFESDRNRCSITLEVSVEHWAT